MCHGCVYTGSFELDYQRTLLAALHVRRIDIPYRAFPERFGPRILSLESADYVGTTDHFSGRKKKEYSVILMSKTSRLTALQKRAHSKTSIVKMQISEK